MSTTVRSDGRVMLKKLASGVTTFEVDVPSSGGSLEEMRQAAETAKTIWAELEQTLYPSRDADVAESDVPF